MVAECKNYFVTVDTQDIREMSIPDSGIEFEIIANPEEVKDIEKLFMAKNKNGRKAVKYINKPFNELEVDNERYNYDDHLITIYRRVYELGTTETKEKINQLGLF